MLICHRSFVVVGPVGDSQGKRLRRAAAEAGVPMCAVDANDLAADPTQKPLALGVVMDRPMAVTSLLHLRARPELSTVPLLGLSKRLDDFAFAELFALGGDDLVASGSEEALATRLRLLSARGRPSGRPVGRVVLASGDVGFSAGVLRVLRRSGYEVDCVTHPDDLMAKLAGPDVAFVLSTDLIGGTSAVLEAGRARLRGIGAPWVIACETSSVGATTRAIGNLAKVMATDVASPPDSFLFIANELAFLDESNGRASARLLYGSPVAFRVAGQATDDYGFSHNISERGLFIRTLAPPDRDAAVWIDIRPPNARFSVRLAAVVRWRQVFGSTGGAPAGFGVEITDGLEGDVARYVEAYRSLADMGAPIPAVALAG